ncbi:MAG: cobalt ECF transporter T component CbiQ [bacterium]
MSFGDYIEVGRMDELARMDSSVHRLDARIKVLTTVAFIIAVMSFPRYEVSALMPFFLYPVVLMMSGNIPPGYILRKVLIAAPFALAVGILNPVFDRETAVSIGSYGISGGWLSFASIAIRFILTVSAALSLVACTGIHRLCSGMARMGLPDVFAVQLQLLYRYLFVIANDALRMMRAVEVRSVGRHVLRIRTYASIVGHLLLRSMDRAQRVYQAMVSRGYEGSVRVMSPTKLRMEDLVFLAGWIACFIVARFWNISLWLGRVFTGEWK